MTFLNLGSLIYMYRVLQENLEPFLAQSQGSQGFITKYYILYVYSILFILKLLKLDQDSV